MEENKNEMVMEEAIEEPTVTVEVEETTGLSTGLAMLIGSGLTLAAIAGGKKLKKIWENHKAKKSGVTDEDDVIFMPNVSSDDQEDDK